MALPFFYIENYSVSSKQIELDDSTSAHVIQVLRMRAGEHINVTDGNGNLIGCTISLVHKKKCIVDIDIVTPTPAPRKKITIAISLLKTVSRFEWFLEKATEIGVSEIIPLICSRTEKEKFRYERMQAICISAMLQSQQTWLPVLHQPEKFEDLRSWQCKNGINYIAHCNQDNKKQLMGLKVSNSTTTDEQSLICIGPEGDFTEKEISLASEVKFIPVSLGDNRLRTETAGVVAATLLKML